MVNNRLTNIGCRLGKITEMNIPSPDQSKWTSGLSWCEYTLTLHVMYLDSRIYESFTFWNKLQKKIIFQDILGAFKSCRIHRIYELNAHERHHKVVITSGKLEIFFKPRVSELGAWQWKNVSDAAKD